MSKIYRFVAVMLMAVFSSAAFAATSYYYYWSGDATERYESFDAACAARLAVYQANQPASNWVSYDLNGTSVTSRTCVIHSSSSTYAPSFTIRRGEEDLCPVGRYAYKSYGIGWSTTGEDDISGMTVNSPPAAYCDGTCAYQYNALMGAEVDEEPTENGNYEIVGSFEYASTGQDCSVPTADPDNPEPTGGTGGDGSGGDGGDGSGGDGGGDEGGEGGDGSDGGDEGEGGDGEDGGDGGGGDEEEGGGNENGNGNGGTGTGGTGGGSSSGSGEGSSETGDGVQEACGAPGQPVCAVKVDETGTPTTFDQGNLADVFDALEDQNSDHLDQLGDPDTSFFEGIEDFFYVPAPVACQPIMLPVITEVTGLSYDVCGVVNGIRKVTTFIWYAVALFLGLGMIRRAL